MQNRPDKGRKQRIFCSTSSEKSQGNIFSHSNSEKRVYASTEVIKEEPSERRKANIQTSVDAAEIPEYVFESLARSLLPVIQKYYESEDGKKAFAKWKAKKQSSAKGST